MKKLNLVELYKSDYNVKAINALRQQWEDVKSWSTTAPKRSCLLLMLDGYEADYTFPGGRKVHAPDGSVVYTAMGSVYGVTFKNTRKNAFTEGINFYIESDGEKTVLDGDIAVFSVDAEIKVLFDRAVEASDRHNPVIAELKAAVYSILSALGSALENANERDMYGVIGAGVRYIQEHYDKNESVEEAAHACCVSSVWFRRLFKKYTGTSPVEYRTELRLIQAAKYLAYGNMSVQEISLGVGYDDVSLFIRRFKRKFGLTPLGYRNAKRNEI